MSLSNHLRIHCLAGILLLAISGCAGTTPEEVEPETPALTTEDAKTRVTQPASQQASATAAPAVRETRPARVEQETTARTGSAAESQLEAPSFPPAEIDTTASVGSLGAAPLDAGETQTQALPVPASPRRVTVPAGTAINVLLIDPLSTTANQPGDEFLASLDEPLMDGSEVLVDAGVTLRGRVVEAREAGRVQGRANIQLVLTHVLPLGEPIPISTRPFIEEAEADLGRDATFGGLGAAAGAAIGALTGGGKGAAIGAVAGGAGTVAATRGRQLEYPAETRLVFELDRDVELPRIHPSSLTTGERLGF